jgi:transaldolase/glucose-6-phosphate isomerase
MYFEALIGCDTVVTVPSATMDAFRDRGEVTSDIIEQDEEGARAVLVVLHEFGISLTEVTEELLEEGAQ